MARFKVVRGKHNEGGVTYNRGDVVDSKSDLSKLNAPGAIKFEKCDDDDAAAERQAMRRGRALANPNDPDNPAAPSLSGTAGQVGTGIQGAKPQQAFPRNEAEARATLEKMSEKELRDMAASEEIDVKGAKSKNDVINVLLKSRK